MKPTIACIDIGFIYTKAIVGNQRVLLKSVAGESKKLNFSEFNMGEHEALTIRFSGNEMFVSDHAISQSDTVYYSLKPNRFDDRTIKALVNTVWGLSFGNGEHKSMVVSGLPVSHYQRFRSDIETLFMGVGSRRHQYTLLRQSGVTGEVLEGSVETLQGRFIPQPFGVVVDNVLDDRGGWRNKELAKKTIAVIDIGFGTTDVYVVNSLSPIEKFSFSTQTAMNHAYRLISNKIEEKFSVSLLLHEVEQVVKRGYFKKNGTSYSMSDVIAWAFNSTADKLVTEIYNKWGNSWEIDDILLAGGGGIALRQYMLKSFENIKLADDPQWSIVNGYKKWAMRTWKELV